MASANTKHLISHCSDLSEC